MQNKKMRLTLCAAIVIVSAAAAGFLSYSFMGSIVEYEFSKAAEEQVSGNTETYNTDVDYIPYSDSYSLHLKDHALYVKDANGDTVYVRYEVDSSVFSESDAYELNGNGIFFPTRSELIDTLNYLNS